MRQIIISSDGIQDGIRLDQLKENKAPGLDNLPPFLLKSLSAELAPCPQVLYQSTSAEEHTRRLETCLRDTPLQKRVCQQA